MTRLTFALDWRAAGHDPVRYHVVGLVAHLLATVAAFAWMLALASRAGHPRAWTIALVVASLFALHPIQADAVAYAAQRSEVLASVFYLATLLLLDRATSRWRTWGGLASWGGGIATWIVGMGAKTIAISAPGAFLSDQMVVAPADDRGLPALWRRSVRAAVIAAPALVLGAWSAVLHFRHFDATPGTGAGLSGTSLGPSAYLLTQMRVQWLYLRLLAWPSGFSIDRAFEPSLRLDASVLLAAAGIVLVVLLALVLWWKAEQEAKPAPSPRLISFGILFWFVALSPTSTFVPVADLAVEHRVYLAALGPFLVGTVAIDWAVHRLRSTRAARVAGSLLALAILGVLAFTLHARAQVWGSSVALWREADRVSPGRWRILHNLGLALHEKGDLAAAETAYRAAWVVARTPGEVTPLARNLTSLLVEAGKSSEALPIADRALEDAPTDAGLLGNRAAALAALGRRDEALEAARRAVEASPANPVLRGILGQALAAKGDWPSALAQFEEGARLDPNDARLAVTRASALLVLGRRSEACAVLRDARRRFPPGSLPAGTDGLGARAGCPAD